MEVAEHGRTHLYEAEPAIMPDAALVTVRPANNETGVLQPIDGSRF